VIVGGLPICGREVTAHDLFRSESALVIDRATVRVQFSINLLEFKGVDANGDGQVTYDELDARVEDIFSLITQHYRLRAPAQPSRAVMQRQQIVDDHVLRADLVYTFDGPVRDLRVDSTLEAATTPGHVHSVRTTINGETFEALLTPQNRSANFLVGGFTIGRLVVALLALGAVAAGLAVRLANRNSARRSRRPRINTETRSNGERTEKRT
jgi:hypothetical protein